MIRSMTGFGRGEATKNNIRVTVEVKTLNSRYLDISPRMPGSIQDKELDLKEIVQKRLSRGKVLLNVYVDKSKMGLTDTTFNPDKLKSYSTMSPLSWTICWDSTTCLNHGKRMKKIWK